MKFQVSNDNTTWTTLHTIDPSMHLGINIHKPDTNTAYRYVKFVGNSSTACKLAEFKVYGKRYLDPFPSTIASVSCPVTVSLNGYSTTLANIVTYSNSVTPTVTDISPNYGWQLGGDTITITGTGFGTSAGAVSVVIDGIACAVSSAATTSIVCVTGDKGASNMAPASLSISVNSNNAIIADGVEFHYGLKWSEDATWGGDAPPRAGDSIYVPKG